MKKILGLDLGTNSIGWALIEHSFENEEGKIQGLGSRIIPMSQDILGKFDAGQSISQTAERTGYRSVRKLYQRDNLRRDRLHRVLNILGFLPEHYAHQIDFDKNPGQYKKGQEPKLAYAPKPNDDKEQRQSEFLFKASFDEMVVELRKSQPQLFTLKKNGEEKKVPYDWTIYYLRKKALTQVISKQELAWIILNFNQKRGYYQLRGEEEEESKDKVKTFEILQVASLKDSGETIKNSGDKLYDVFFENGWLYDKQVTKPENWLGKEKEFIVTSSITKSGETKRTFKAVNSEEDWIAIKKKTEQEVDRSSQHIGEYIFDQILKSPHQKIRGKLIKTIERKYYKKELLAILEKQAEFHDEFQNKELCETCANELYPRNEAHFNSIKDRGLSHLFVEDIIFYQRPLKSKKSTISNCQYEVKTFKHEGEYKRVSLKAIPKSHPLFQEFRLWQFIQNLQVYQKEVVLDGVTKIDYPVTSIVLSTEELWVELFNAFSKRKEISQQHLLDFLSKQGQIKKDEKDNYRWNYVEDKKYPAMDTLAQFQSRLAGLKDSIPVNGWFAKDKLHHLWHIVYSVKDKVEYEKALGAYASRYNLPVSEFVEAFKKFPPFKNDYGAYSEKAIKKLLPLMRMGDHWNENNIHPQVSERIEKFITGEYDEKISDRAREKVVELQRVEDFRGLPLWLAAYVVYGRHSESKDVAKWRTPEDIDVYLDEFRQHQLRNPIVEQVVTETLRVVRDIWKKLGHGATDFFDEIHLELGREMKNPAKKREQMSRNNLEKERTNQRIKQLLTALMNDGVGARPYSPSHQEILKIYDEGVYQSLERVEDDIEKIRRNNNPSSNDITRYKLWLEQGYISPYTGEIIPLNRLFSTDYQIEHIIPRSRFFDDSLSNKVICESEVNAEKDNLTAYEFIKNTGTSIIQLSENRRVPLLSLAQYEAHCNRYFRKNRTKLKKLLSEDIPDSFIERQMNDSRYISKFIMSLLSNIVREQGEIESRSKNLITLTGSITSKLKQDWGLNHKWNELISPRFQRLNELTKTENFGYWDKNINAFRCMVPDELAKGFSKKRIDHRHHALDALVIACTTQNHVNYITSLNTQRENHKLVSQLRIREKTMVKGKERTVAKAYKLPWRGFPVQAKAALEKTVISFKQNLRVINKTNNKTWQWVEEKGDLKKRLIKQTKGDSWAIRKPLHKDTVSGKVTIKRIKSTPVLINSLLETPDLIVDKTIKGMVKAALYLYQGNVKKVKKHFKENPLQIKGQKIMRVEAYEFIEATASRMALSEGFTRKQLDKVTDSGIRKILNKHLKNYVDEQGKEQFDLAFGDNGLSELNANIKALNDGIEHAPIKKVRVYEEGNKFNVGTSGNKKDKYVEAAKGTNLFFSIYWDEEKQRRIFETLPLYEVIEHQKQTAHLPKHERTDIPIKPEKGRFLFSLSPNDLVYVPNEEETETPGSIDFKNLDQEQVNRIYKMVSTTQDKLDCVFHSYASAIQNNEVGTNNKSQNTLDGQRQIKRYCWKLQVNRLGKIIKFPTFS